jgi:hypothetical protein
LAKVDDEKGREKKTVKHAQDFSSDNPKSAIQNPKWLHEPRLFFKDEVS